MEASASFALDLPPLRAFFFGGSSFSSLSESLMVFAFFFLGAGSSAADQLERSWLEPSHEEPVAEEERKSSLELWLQLLPQPESQRRARAEEAHLDFLWEEVWDWSLPGKAL